MTTTEASGDKTMVLAQLERVLASPAFRNSKRASSLLRHIVERTVDGRAGEIRERSLGVEVFGRAADYDNTEDPVVRTSASEVRKRIAQYYDQPVHGQELRIDLPPGTYVPEFRTPVTVSAPVEVIATEVREARLERGDATVSRRGWATGGLGVVCLAALLLWRPWVRADALEEFWRPYLNDGSPVIICLSVPMNADSPDPAPRGPRLIAWPDTTASMQVGHLLGSLHQPIEVRSRESVTFEDLRNRSAVLIGAFNDIWTLRLTENLRFEFRRDGNLRWIQDNKNAATRKWGADFSAPAASRHEYAMISRLLTGRSGQPVVAIAGLGGLGTEMAGEFVTSRTALADVAKRAADGWQSRNLQIVIGTEVIDGHAGPARIEAIESW